MTGWTRVTRLVEQFTVVNVLMTIVIILRDGVPLPAAAVPSTINVLQKHPNSHCPSDSLSVTQYRPSQAEQT